MNNYKEPFVLILEMSLELGMSPDLGMSHDLGMSPDLGIVEGGDVSTFHRPSS